MKVLYYHQYFKTRNASGGTRSYEFARRLVMNGHQVTVVCARNSKEDLSLNGFKGRGYKMGFIDDIKVIQIDLFTSNKQNIVRRGWGFILFAFRSIRFAFTEKYDVLFASSTPFTIGIPGVVVKFFRPKTVFVFEVRDLWPELPKAMGVIKNRIVLALMKWLEGITYRSANACIGLSPGMVEGIHSRGVDKMNIEMIPNACDLDLFVPGKQDKTIISGCDNDSFIAVFTGTHGKANGLHYVLDVAEYLISVNETNIKFVFIGDGGEKQKLMNSAKSRNLNNCIFLNPVPKKQLIELLQAADVGMMILENVPAFAYGTSPNKFFDYISMGLPVIVNHYGWVADLVTEYKCGFAASPVNCHEFGDRLRELKNNKNLRSFMGSNSRKLAENKFNREDLAHKFEDFLIKTHNKSKIK